MASSVIVGELSGFVSPTAHAASRFGAMVDSGSKPGANWSSATVPKLGCESLSLAETHDST